MIGSKLKFSAVTMNGECSPLSAPAPFDPKSCDFSAESSKPAPCSVNRALEWLMVGLPTTIGSTLSYMIELQKRGVSTDPIHPALAKALRRCETETSRGHELSGPVCGLKASQAMRPGSIRQLVCWLLRRTRGLRVAPHIRDVERLSRRLLGWLHRVVVLCVTFSSWQGTAQSA